MTHDDAMTNDEAATIHVLPCHIETKEVAGSSATTTFDQATYKDDKTRIFQGRRLIRANPPSHASFFMISRKRPVLEKKIKNLCIWCTDEDDLNQVDNQWKILSSLTKLMTDDATQNGG